jgi:hypothetical protein
MKKLKLKALELGVSELLTRAQLRNVLGGDGSGSGSGTCHFHCCTDQHTNCSDYVSSSYSCMSASDCNSTQASCPSGHLYWSCF